MTATTDVQAVRETHQRGGTGAVRKLIWALERETQMRLAIDLYNEGEIELMAASVSDEMEHDMRPTGLPGLGVYHGSSEYLGFLRDWLEAFPDSRLEIQSIETRGAFLFSVIDQEMRGAASGVPVGFSYAALIGYRDERPVSSEFHLDLDAARRRFAELAGDQTG